jgi:hypothetical protein
MFPSFSTRLSRSKHLSFALFRGIDRISLLLVLALFATSVAAAPNSADPTRYLDDIKALTTPAMEGRGDGTPGLTGSGVSA